jgi:hypothetical protein
MLRYAALFVLIAAVVFLPPPVQASRKTVCTITVNSPDEKEFLQRTLPKDEFDFIELVERGRPDWLASACRKGVKCDVLLISGHFDGGTQFYSDRLHVDEYLPVDEMERVACSASCPGLFSQLKEVYLMGCNTLNAQPMRTAGGELERSLLRAGYSKADATQLAQTLGARHAESNRDRMRNIFKDVPVIYGFSSKAPLGPYAAATLQKYFQSGPAGEFGSGRPSGRLLSLFAPVSMTVVNGARDDDVHAGFRRDACQFADDRLTPAQKLAFVHSLLRRDIAEGRMFLDAIERQTGSISMAERQSPAVSAVLGEIGRDHASRDRFLEFARDADEPSTRTRMLAVARTLGWLTADQHQAELRAMIDEHLAGKPIGSSEVDLFCSMNREHPLVADPERLRRAALHPSKVGQSAVLACLGERESHARVLEALTGSDGEALEIAQVYLQHRPITDADEMRVLTRGIAKMPGSDAQVRALDTLARQKVSDVASLDELLRLYTLAKSVNVQRAIAGILIRADYKALPQRELVSSLSKHRLKSSDGADLIDVLIRRAQAQ